MNLKQHNDIVQKLITQIQDKDKQIKQLNKNLNKQLKINDQTSLKNTKAPSSVQTQKIIQKRIAQLNKQHANKIAQLNQQIKTLTSQNQSLKERLSLKTQMEIKQKQHIVQVMKKNFDRKPGTQHDHKVAALISHYEQQINKKNTFIQTLKRQIKSLSLNKQTDSGIKIKKLTQINNQNIDKNQQDQNSQQQNNQQYDLNNQSSSTGRKTISLVKHKQQISNFQNSIKKIQSKLDEKSAQLKDLKLKYNDLTKQYYRVVNQYGVTSQFGNKTTSNKTKVSNSNKEDLNFKKTNKIPSYSKLSNLQSSKQTKLSFALSEDTINDNQNPLSNLLLQISNDGQDANASISIDFQQKFKKFNSRPQLQADPNLQSNIKLSQLILDKKNHSNKNYQLQNSSQITRSDQIIYQVKNILNVSSQNDIIPHLTNLMTKFNDFQLYDAILKSIHSFFYKFGMGKVAKTDMLEVLQLFQDKCNKWIQSNDLIDQICIEIGSKKQKIIEKINQLKQIQNEYLQKMRNIDFLNQINKSHKIVEFINFFELDKSDLNLPEQLKNIYQQLRYVDKFIKQANSTMNVELKDKKGLQGTLELILRKLQRYHEWQVQLQKQNQRKAAKKAIKVKQ